jgi:hypothetical protein
MDEIVKKQSILQSIYATMEGYPLLDPNKFEDFTVGEVYDFIRHMKFCLNEELTELMEELGNGSRDIHKPWASEYFNLRNKSMKSTQSMREEGIDSLCFLINILLAVGITPCNIYLEYLLVLKKNMERIGKYNEAKAIEQKKRETC